MEFLSRNKVPYVEKNIRTDEEALNELLALGSNGTPTFVIDGKVVIGFDPDKLLPLLR